jgi:hypothetical protein
MRSARGRAKLRLERDKRTTGSMPREVLAASLERDRGFADAPREGDGLELPVPGCEKASPFQGIGTVREATNGGISKWELMFGPLGPLGPAYSISYSMRWSRGWRHELRVGPTANTLSSEGRLPPPARVLAPIHEIVTPLSPRREKPPCWRCPRARSAPPDALPRAS